MPLPWISVNEFPTGGSWSCIDGPPTRGRCLAWPEVRNMSTLAFATCSRRNFPWQEPSWRLWTRFLTRSLILTSWDYSLSMGMAWALDACQSNWGGLLGRPCTHWEMFLCRSCSVLSCDPAALPQTPRVIYKPTFSCNSYSRGPTRSASFQQAHIDEWTWPLMTNDGSYVYLLVWRFAAIFHGKRQFSFYLPKQPK